MSLWMWDHWRWFCFSGIWGLIYFLAQQKGVFQNIVTIDCWKKKATSSQTNAAVSSEWMKQTTLPSRFKDLKGKVEISENAFYYSLCTNQAFLGTWEADLTHSSFGTVIFMSLKEVAPQLVVSPLPTFEMHSIENTGIVFKNDPNWMKKFVTEGESPKAIGTWLTPKLRKSLLLTPRARIFANDKQMVLAIYGRLSLQELEKMVEVADVFFEEYGESKNCSLYG